MILSVLLDSSEGASLIATQNIKHYGVPVTSNAAWQTIFGNFNTAGKMKAKFALPELNPTGKVTFNLHLAATLGAHDISLGKDLLQELGILLYFKQQIIACGHANITMKTSNCTAMYACGISDPTYVE